MRTIVLAFFALACSEGDGFTYDLTPSGGAAGVSGSAGSSSGGNAGSVSDAGVEASLGGEGGIAGTAGAAGSSGAPSGGAAGAAGAGGSTVDAGPTLPEHPQCFWPNKPNASHWWSGGVCFACDAGTWNCDGIDSNGCEVTKDEAPSGTVCAFCGFKWPEQYVSCKLSGGTWKGCCDPSNTQCDTTAGDPLCSAI